MSAFFTYQDQVFDFEGCLSIQQGEGWASPWRISYQDQDLYPELCQPDVMQARLGSGVRLVCQTDSQQLALHLEAPAKDYRLDFCVNNQLLQSFSGSGVNGVYTLDLPAGDKLVQLWFDSRYPVYVRGIAVNVFSYIHKPKGLRKRWLHYGSSISQANAADSPAQSWTAIAARQLNLDLVNMGFGGRCILAPMMGICIRDTPCDLITMKLGINSYPGRLGEFTYQANAIGLVRLVREARPNVPLLLISPIYSAPRECEKYSPNGLNLVEMRRQLQEVVKIFQKRGDANIYYMDGLELLNGSEAYLMPDNLHPNGTAQKIMADRIVPVLQKFL